MYFIFLFCFFQIVFSSNTWVSKPLPPSLYLSLLPSFFNVSLLVSWFINFKKRSKSQCLTASTLFENESKLGKKKMAKKCLNKIFLKRNMSPVSPVFHTEVTVSIGLKKVLRVGRSIVVYFDQRLGAEQSKRWSK